MSMVEKIKAVDYAFDCTDPTNENWFFGVRTAIAAALAEAEKVDTENAMLRLRRERFYADACEWRDVEPENACAGCSGSGVKVYCNTATWVGGIGGNAMTAAICDKCWGSGNKHRPWADLRELRRERDELRRMLDANIEAEGPREAEFKRAREAWLKLSPLVSIMSAFDIEQANRLDQFFGGG